MAQSLEEGLEKIPPRLDVVARIYSRVLSPIE